jgi:pSer/pThr/pTyr-binding forkhead associated (FHA) protein
LERAIVTIGRGEDNDIWLDDDLASRYHAELAWDNGRTYITDCYSLNGVFLNRRRIRGSTRIEAGELLEIGSQRFLFEKAEQPGAPSEQDDPLTRHVWHSSTSLSTDSEQMPMTQLLNGDTSNKSNLDAQSIALTSAEDKPVELQDTAELNPVTPPQAARPIHGGPTPLRLPSRPKNV